MKDVSDMTLKEALAARAAAGPGGAVTVRIASYDLQGLAACIEMSEKIRDAQARAGRELAAPFKGSACVEQLVGAAIIAGQLEQRERLDEWLDIAERAEARKEDAA